MLRNHQKLMELSKSTMVNRPEQNEEEMNPFAVCWHLFHPQRVLIELPHERRLCRRSSTPRDGTRSRIEAKTGPREQKNGSRGPINQLRKGPSASSMPKGGRQYGNRREREKKIVTPRRGPANSGSVHRFLNGDESGLS